MRWVCKVFYFIFLAFLPLLLFLFSLSASSRSALCNYINFCFVLSACVFRCCCCCCCMCNVYFLLHCSTMEVVFFQCFSSFAPLLFHFSPTFTAQILKFCKARTHIFMQIIGHTQQFRMIISSRQCKKKSLKLMKIIFVFVPYFYRSIHLVN